MMFAKNRTRRRPPIVLTGATIALCGLARLVGAERLSRAVRKFDQRSGLFTTCGTGLYSRVAPGLLRPLYERVASDVTAELDHGSVLDVGTGPGLVALEIARRRPDLDVIGVDIAPSMLKEARANARSAGLKDRVRFQVGDAARLPYPDSSFDLVLSTLSLHHWSDLEAALTELYRALRPGGRLWLYDMRGVSYSARELSSVFANTPFCSTQLEELHVRAGPVPLALYKRFACRRPEERASA